MTAIANKRVEEVIESMERRRFLRAAEGRDGEEEVEGLMREASEREMADESGEEGVGAGNAAGANEEEEGVELGEEAGAGEAVEEGGAGGVVGVGGGEELMEGGGGLAGGGGFEGVVGRSRVFGERGIVAVRF